MGSGIVLAFDFVYLLPSLASTANLEVVSSLNLPLQVIYLVAFAGAIVNFGLERLIKWSREKKQKRINKKRGE